MSSELSEKPAADPTIGKIINGSSEQQLLDTFAGISFNKEEAADTLGISPSGAYKLLQSMVDNGLLTARMKA